MNKKELIISYFKLTRFNKFKYDPYEVLEHIIFCFVTKYYIKQIVIKPISNFIYQDPSCIKIINNEISYCGFTGKVCDNLSPEQIDKAKKEFYSLVLLSFSYFNGIDFSPLVLTKHFNLPNDTNIKKNLENNKLPFITKAYDIEQYVISKL